MIGLEDGPAAVFSLVAALLLANVWLSVRMSGPSPKRRASLKDRGDQSDA